MYYFQMNLWRSANMSLFAMFIEKGAEQWYLSTTKKEV